jgi:hypothetical protein
MNNLQPYINENIRNWLLGGSEIDPPCPAIPPHQETPEKLFHKFQNASDKKEISKIVSKLEKLGSEIKTVHVLNKKS